MSRISAQRLPARSLCQPWHRLWDQVRVAMPTCAQGCLLRGPVWGHRLRAPFLWHVNLLWCHRQKVPTSNFSQVKKQVLASEHTGTVPTAALQGHRTLHPWGTHVTHPVTTGQTGNALREGPENSRSPVSATFTENEEVNCNWGTEVRTNSSINGSSS